MELRPIFKVEDRIPEAVTGSLRAKGHEVRSVKDDGGLVNGIAGTASSGIPRTTTSVLKGRSILPGLEETTRG